MRAGGVVGGMEGLLQQLLAAPLPHDPETLTLHARALEGFGRLLAADPSAMPAVIQRVRLAVTAMYQYIHIIIPRPSL